MVPIDEFIIPPEAETKPKQNDIALIVLGNPVLFSSHIQPICLPSLPDQDMTRQIFYVSGWGYTKLGKSSNPYAYSRGPKRVGMISISEEECNKNHGIIQCYECGLPSIICAFGARRFNETINEDACQGDSGGKHKFFRYSQFFPIVIKIK